MRYLYVCHTKQGRKICALWRISWYHKVYHARRCVAQTELIIAELNCICTPGHYVKTVLCEIQTLWEKMG